MKALDTLIHLGLGAIVTVWGQSVYELANGTYMARAYLPFHAADGMILITVYIVTTSLFVYHAKCIFATFLHRRVLRSRRKQFGF
jgi:hypothetical protein